MSVQDFTILRYNQASLRVVSAMGLKSMSKVCCLLVLACQACQLSAFVYSPSIFTSSNASLEIEQLFDECGEKWWNHVRFLRTVLILPLQATGYLKMAFFFQVTSLSCRTSSRGSKVSWESSSHPKARTWWIINREIRCKAWWCSIQPCRLIRYLEAVKKDWFSQRVLNWIKFSYHRTVFITSLG